VPGTQRFKRSDITPLMLCAAIAEHGTGALDVLHRTYPAKVLVAAVYRDVTRGYITYGVTCWRPFLDHRGRALLIEHGILPAPPRPLPTAPPRPAPLRVVIAQDRFAGVRAIVTAPLP
jgi:hypothetical protein